MEKTFIAVRDVDVEVYRKFRARAIQERLKLGKALTHAMREWAERNKANYNKKHGPQIKPFDWGHGTEKTSEEIDKILYGPRK